MIFSDIEVLSETELDKIHSAALKILEEIGFKSDCRELIDMMRNEGAVDEEDVIHISHRLVENAIESAPPVFRLYDPSGSTFKMIGEGNSLFKRGHQAVFVLDHVSS